MSVAITLDWGHKGLSVIDIEYISHYWGHKGLIVIDIGLTEYISGTQGVKCECIVCISTRWSCTEAVWTRSLLMY